ncbi:MAG: diacylglycerol kinase family protein [Pseudomonadota bacterium]
MTEPERPRRLLVIFNPTAGGARKRYLDATLKALEALGCPITLWPTAAPGHAESLARAVTLELADVVVAAGGDGTINEVVNGLLDATRYEPPLPLAVLPLGTANVLAHELGLPRRAGQLARAIATGAIRPVGLGRVDQRYFLSMIGVGFDAQVVASVDLALKRRLGKAAYVIESVRQLISFRSPGYRLTIADTSHRAASAIVTRGRFYGGRFVCAPQASLFSPRFQLCRFTRSGPWNVIRYGALLVLGRLPKAADFKIEGAERLTIEGPEGDPVQGDGDLIGRLPVTVELVPDALNLVVPNDA